MNANPNGHTVHDPSVLTANQRFYRSYVAAHPGCSIADVCRASASPKVEYVWDHGIYTSIRSLVRRNVLRCERQDGKGRTAKVRLYVVEAVPS